MITRKQVLLECLQAVRKQRDKARDAAEDLRKADNKFYKNMLAAFERDEMIAQQKVDILQDIIHYLDTPHGREGMAEWQRQEMKDPERCRREAMDFALDEIRM